MVNDGAASNTAVTSAVGLFHAPPTLTASGTAAFVQGGAAVTLDSGVTLTAPDSSGDFSSATIKVAGGVFSTDGDTLAAVTAGTGITASYAAASETLTLSGVDTLAHYQQVLDTVTFSSTGAVSGSRTIDWAVNDGVSSSATSTSTVTVHDRPTVSAGATATFVQGGSAVALDTSVALSAADSGGNISSATVSVAGGAFATDGDTLAAITTGTGITASYVAASETLTLSGVDTVANYEPLLDSITFSFAPTGDPPSAARTPRAPSTGASLMAPGQAPAHIPRPARSIRACGADPDGGRHRDLYRRRCGGAARWWAGGQRRRQQRQRWPARRCRSAAVLSMATP